MSNWKGTAVPNSGYVEKVYFNTNLSVEEVINIVTSLDYDWSTDIPYYPLINEEITSLIMMMGNNPTYAFVISVGDSYVFAHNMEDMGMVEGWNMEIANQPYEVNSLVLSSAEGIEVGHLNDKLSSLFSITPFTKSVTLEELLTDTCDAIREKEGTTNEIPALDIPARIRALSSGSSELSSPTAVPISGMVEKVYFNFNGDVQKMGELIATLSYVEVPNVGTVYPIISNADMSVGMTIVKGTVTNSTQDYTYYSLTAQFGSVVKEIAQFRKDNIEGSFYVLYLLLYDLSQPLEFGIENYVEALSANFPTYVNSNELLKEMISITPIQKIESGSSIVGYKGTTVPNEGYVEKVYFNTNLSAEEVKEIIKGITLYDYDGQVSDFILFSSSIAIIISQYYENGVLVDKYGIGGMNLTTEEEFMIFNGETWETFDNPLIIDSTVNNSLEGKPIGSQNSKLSELFSITPFEEVSTEEFVEECSSAILEAKGEQVWNGSAVPNSGTVEKVYLNINLSYDEVQSILSSSFENVLSDIVNVNGTDYTPLGIVAIDENNYMVISATYSNDSSKFGIVGVLNGSETILFDEDSGWTTAGLATPFFEINSEVISYIESLTIYFGKYNAQLSHLFSITPFTKNSIYPTLIPDEIRKLSNGGSGQEVYIPLSFLISSSVTGDSSEAFCDSVELDESNMVFNNPDNIPIYASRVTVDVVTGDMTVGDFSSYTGTITPTRTGSSIETQILIEEGETYFILETYSVKQSDLIGKTVPYLSGIVVNSGTALAYDFVYTPQNGVLLKNCNFSSYSSGKTIEKAAMWC